MLHNLSLQRDLRCYPDSPILDINQLSLNPLLSGGEVIKILVGNVHKPRKRVQTCMMLPQTNPPEFKEENCQDNIDAYSSLVV